MSDNRHPILSVVVTTFDDAPYIQECLDSICTQTLRDIEILVMDDASQDATPAVVAEMAAKDARIRLYTSTENSGSPTRGRNVGIEKARGDFVAFVDGDDKVGDVDFLMAMVADMQTHRADVGYCGSSMYHRVGKNRYAVAYIMDYYWHYTTEKGERLVWHWKEATPAFWLNTAHGAAFKIYDRDFLQRYHLRFPEVEIEDLPFSIITFLLAKKICYNKRPGYWYRQCKDYKPHRFRHRDFGIYQRGAEGITWMVEQAVRYGLVEEARAELFQVVYAYYGCIAAHVKTYGAAGFSDLRAVYLEMKGALRTLLGTEKTLPRTYLTDTDCADITLVMQLSFEEYLLQAFRKGVSTVTVSPCSSMCHSANPMSVSMSRAMLAVLKAGLRQARDILLGVRCMRRIRPLPRFLRIGVQICLLPLALLWRYRTVRFWITRLRSRA